ncbi:MAG: oligosaccharide flippase family protein, partial [Bradymonadaceae bacterium]
MERRITKLLRNTLSNMGLKLGTLTLGFLLVPVLLRTVGDEGFGLLTLTGTILGYFALLGGGVPAGTVKYVAEHEARHDWKGLREVLDNSFAFFACVGCFAAISLTMFVLLDGLRVFRISEANEEVARTLLLWAAVFSIFQWPTNVFASALEGLQEYHRKNRIVLYTHAVSLLFALLTALVTQDLLLIFFAQQAPIILQRLLLFRAVRSFLPGWIPNPLALKADILKKILGLSVWMFVMQIATMLFYATDEVIISAMLSVSLIAIYKVTIRPFGLVRELLGMFNSAVMPAMSAFASEENTAARHHFIYTGARYSNLFIAPLALGAAIFCGPFIRLWVGEAYMEHVWIAQGACFFQLIWQSNGFLGPVFFGSGKAFRLAMIAIFSAVVNLVLGIWWARTMGVPGVILATIAAGGGGVVVQYLWLLPELQLERWRYLKESVLAGQLPCLVIGMLLLPFWSYFQDLDSWHSLLGHGL